MAAVLAACGGGSQALPPVIGLSGPGVEGPGALTADQMNATLPTAISPESDVPPPIPTALQAVAHSAAAGVRSTKGLNWNPAAGAPSVSALTVSPVDGTLWAVTLPVAGKLDGAIYNNKGGTWQQFTQAAAGSVAVDRQGSVYAVSRSTGGIYEYAAPAATPGPGASPLPMNTWFPIGGHASSVTVGADGTPYILSNTAPTGNNAVYRYGAVPLKTGFHWTQLKGAGVQIAASYDTNGEPVPPAAPTVTFLPNGFFLVHSSGGIFYYNSAGAAPGYVKFPPTPANGSPASSGVAPTLGGLYALAYPSSLSGEKIFKFDYAAAKWLDQGSYLATGLASGVIPSSGATPLYAFSAAGTVSVGSVATPAPGPSTLPFTVSIDAGALTANPKMSPGATNIYIFGQQVPLPGSAPPVWVVAKDATGALSPFPSGTVPPIPFYGGSTMSGLTSQTIQLPPLNSARIYISNGPLAITTTSGPAPWTMDGSRTTTFDFAEYTWVAPSAIFYTDTTQVDGIGLDLTIGLTGSANQKTGLKAGALTQVYNGITALSAPWQTLVSQFPYRVMSPDGVNYGAGPPAPIPTAASGGALPGFYPGTFLDSAILAAWNTYQAPNWLTINGVGGELANAPVYGQVDANGNFNFYLAQSTTGTLVATIPSPFNPAFQFGGGVLSATAYPATWGPATETMMEQNGPYLLPTSISVIVTPTGSPQPNPYPTTYAWPQNKVYPNAAATIGNKVSTALNRGIYSVNPIACPPPSPLYPNAAYQNQYAAVVSTVASNPLYGFGQSYTIPYNDQCGLSTTIQDPAPTGLSITIFKD